jgi:hypothetical protein
MADPQRPAAGLRLPATGSGEPRTDTPASPPGKLWRLPVFPERYSVREREGKRFLECDEAPRLRAVVEPGMAASESAAVALGANVILLDGAGSFGPRIDNDRKLYNLDHHAGCQRLFTLATCEQALLLVHSGLELGEGDWTVYANDPDLDTVLALWCLLNHRRLRELRPEARDVLLPLLRLEGAIDANGPELARLCGLPSDVLEQTWKRIDQLMARERGAKRAAERPGQDVYAFTVEMLRAIDEIVYTPEDFGNYTRIDEVYGHVEIAPRRVAVVCRDRSGIYTVEQHLKARWGDQLSIVALENRPGVYTLRRVSSLSGPDLEPAYAHLNQIDPAVDGMPIEKRWGGSPDIGGSPRPQGTRLSSEEIIEGLARAYQVKGWWRRLARTVAALAVGVAFLAPLPVAVALASLARLRDVSPALRGAFELALFALLSLLIGMLATRAASHRRPWVFGWRRSVPGRWWLLLPIVVACALPVRGYAPEPLGSALPELGAGLLALLLAVAAAEVWFRGLAHGLLALDFPVQRAGGPWFLSRAALVSAAAYALVAVALAAVAPPSGGLERLGMTSRELFAVVGTAAFAGGLALAVVRERSMSLAAGCAFQALGALGSVVVWALLG